MRPTLYDAARCPYCARVRIVLAEKGIEPETVQVDLSDRPAWLYVKNPDGRGRVPVWEEGDWVLTESAVICEYLEELYPDPPLWPADAGARAAARLLVFRFESFSDPYYAMRREEPGATELLGLELARLDVQLARLPFLTGAAFGLADVAYLPWVLRARDLLGFPLGQWPSLAAWVERVSERQSVAVELQTLATLAR